nr:hypothetical protein [Tanacetum cinerariifolium]
MRQRWWIELLSDYECEIKYHPGKANVMVDALSRKERLKLRSVRAMSMTIQSGLKAKILELKRKLPRILRLQLNVCEVGGIRKLIMDEAHTTRYSVHPGADKMYYDLRDLHWWPENLARIAINEIVARHGIPMSIISDRNGRFVSHLWEALQKELGTRLYMSTAYHPQTDGQSESRLTRPEIVQETTKKIMQIRKRLVTTRDRQKKYPDKRRKPLEFKVGDQVLLKVSSWKGVVSFGKKGKLAPWYVESDVRVPLEEIKVDDKLYFVEEPVEILDMQVKKLKRNWIPIVKVRWDSRRDSETRPLMLRRGSYIPWASRFKRYLNRKRENKKWLNKAIDEGLYVFKNYTPPDSQTPRLQTEDVLTRDDLKHYEFEIEAMNLIIISNPNEIYNSVDDCTTVKAMYERVERLMRGTVQNKVVNYDDDYQGDAFQNNSEDPLTSAMMLLTHDETGVTLTDEQNDFLVADANRMEETEELSSNICLMDKIQPANINSDAGPSYDSAFLSEIQKSSTDYVNLLFTKDNQEQKYSKQPKIINDTIGDDQIDSDIIFDAPNEDVNSGHVKYDNNVQASYALEQLALNDYKEAEKQQINANKVKQQNNVLTQLLELYKEKVLVLEMTKGNNTTFLMN